MSRNLVFDIDDNIKGDPKPGEIAKLTDFLEPVPESVNTETSQPKTFLECFSGIRTGYTYEPSNVLHLISGYRRRKHKSIAENNIKCIVSENQKKRVKNLYKVMV